MVIDLGRAGGHSGVRNLLALGQSLGIGVALRGSIETDIGLAHRLHFQSQALASPAIGLAPMRLSTSHVPLSLQFERGEAELPTSPGIGIEVHETTEANASSST